MSKIHDKLKKLLNLAKNQSNTPEGDLAASLAAKIMREHMIRQEELIEEDKEQIAHITDETVSNVWWSILYHAVGKYTNVSICYSAFRGGRSITFVGYPHDIEVCKWLYHSIKNQLDAEWKSLKKMYKKEHVPSWQQDTRKNFFASAVSKVGSRLRWMSRAQKDDFSASETSIILSREGEVQNFAANLGWGKGSSYRYGGSSAGTAAGDKVKIQNGLNGSRRLKG